MRKITYVAAAAALIGSVGVAAAADLGGRSFKDEPLPAGISWGGLYVGGSAGLGVGDFSHTFSKYKYYENDEPSVAQSADGYWHNYPAISEDLNGAIYGGHIGYNFQRGNLVFGVEAGINGTEMDGSVISPELLKTELDWYATGVGRLGYASGKTLFYGFGGVAAGEVQTTALGHFKDDETHVGWTAGLGIEHALNDRLSVRVEYSHVDLGEETIDFGSDCVKDKVDVEFDAVKVGASYKLTGERALESLK